MGRGALGGRELHRGLQARGRRGGVHRGVTLDRGRMEERGVSVREGGVTCGGVTCPTLDL